MPTNMKGILVPFSFVLILEAVTTETAFILFLRLVGAVGVGDMSVLSLLVRSRMMLLFDT